MAKDKQLQAERKRKAAAFVNMLKGGPSSLPLSNSTASLDNLASRSDDEGKYLLITFKDRKSNVTFNHVLTCSLIKNIRIILSIK